MIKLGAEHSPCEKLWSAIQVIPPLVLNPVVHDIPTLRQTNLIHILPYFLCKYSFDSVLPSTPKVFKVGCCRVSVAHLSEALRYTPEVRGWKFSLTLSFRPHYGPGVDSASNRNEYQEYFLVGKGGRCIGLTLPPSCAILESRSLNLLEPSGPVQGLFTSTFCLAKMYSFHVSVTRAKLAFESILHSSCSINSTTNVSGGSASHRLPRHADFYRPVSLSSSSPAFVRTPRC